MSQTGANDFARIRPGFKNAGIPDDLIDALFDAYAEAKRRFYLGDHRPNEVEGGRFTEAAFRILELKVLGAYTRIGKQIPTVDKLVSQSTGATTPHSRSTSGNCTRSTPSAISGTSPISAQTSAPTYKTRPLLSALWIG